MKKPIFWILLLTLSAFAALSFCLVGMNTSFSTTGAFLVFAAMLLVVQRYEERNLRRLRAGETPPLFQLFRNEKGARRACITLGIMAILFVILGGVSFVASLVSAII